MLGSAIDEDKKQNLALELTKKNIDDYHDKIDFNKLFTFIKKNVSLSAALNKTEKKYFVYSFLVICSHIIKYSDD